MKDWILLRHHQVPLADCAAGTLYTLFDLRITTAFEDISVFIFFKDLFLFLLNVYGTSVWLPKEARRVSYFPELESQSTVSHQMNSGPLEEQQVFLAIEPSLQPHFNFFNRLKF